MGVDQEPVVVMSRAELRELIEQAAVLTLQQFVTSQPDPWRVLKAPEMAARLSISEAQLCNLVGEGCPFVPVGAVGRRFDPTEVLAWLRNDYHQRGSVRRPASAPVAGPVKASGHPIRRRSAPSAA
jgi:hypothetical protein